ncbi:MAG TPA: aquaporin [Rhizomicrobium sp.]|nr:aquaporin [Rhizomicrobium sp.]
MSRRHDEEVQSDAAGKAGTAAEREHAAAREFHNPSREWRRVFAEAWGTFLLVLVAMGGALAAEADSAHFSHEAAAVAPGLIVMAVIYFAGSVSGAHINPAVTLAFALRGNFPWTRVPLYLMAQFAGGIAAAAVMRELYGITGEFGATLPGPGVGDMTALAAETIATAGLVNTILGTASGARNVGTNAAIAVGGYIAVAGVWCAFLSGASMNPARSLAPDVMRGNFAHAWIYLVGPLLGAAIGVGFEWILKGAPTRAGTAAAQGSDRG